MCSVDKLLESFDIFTFEWDIGNSLKSEEKHGVSIEPEVKETAVNA